MERQVCRMSAKNMRLYVALVCDKCILGHVLVGRSELTDRFKFPWNFPLLLDHMLPMPLLSWQSC
jgi:hypothetical protein